MSTNHVTERPAGREHIPLYPKGFIVARIIQLVIGIICLGLTAYAVAIIPINGAALMLFTAIVTLLTSIYILVAHFGPPAAYNYWAILGLDIFHAIFWLISFALLASEAAAFLAVASAYDDVYRFYGVTNYDKTYGAIIAAAAGLGGVVWVAYIVTLILHSIAFHRHRSAGLHAMPGRSTSATTAPAVGGAPVGGEKIQMEPQQPQAYYAPQQTPQQPQAYPHQQTQQQPEAYPHQQTPQQPQAYPHQQTPPTHQIYEASP
ncbi:hypothetical protein HD806DRAFT_534030 [Xylariaceae sp. AK1471]|nr:hypothetical protein HD806DRAFT_534030 [Xylariaceae sp. AK1471]